MHFQKCLYMYKKFTRKLHKNEDIEDIKTLQVNFTMIYKVHKISVLLKITIVLKQFLRIIIAFHIFKNVICFSQHIFVKYSKIEEDRNIEENIVKDPTNLVILKKLTKETHDATIEGRKNLFGLKQKMKYLKII